MGENLGQRMTFVKTRDSGGMLRKLLSEDSYSDTTIHGTDTPEDRDKMVKEFKDGLTQVLVATNRGFDQQHVLISRVLLILFPSTQLNFPSQCLSNKFIRLIGCFCRAIW